VDFAAGSQDLAGIRARVESQCRDQTARLREHAVMRQRLLEAQAVAGHLAAMPQTAVESSPAAMLASIHAINSQLASLRAALEQVRANLRCEGRPPVNGPPLRPPSPPPPTLQPAVANAVAALLAGTETEVCTQCALRAIAYGCLSWVQSVSHYAEELQPKQHAVGCVSIQCYLLAG